jgi:hypothetical protein
VHLKGSLLNEFVGLKTGTNFQGFFGGTGLQHLSEYWVYAEPYNNISPNANTFIAPSLEGGNNGIRIVDPNPGGSVYIYGGSIEGLSGVGLYFDDTVLPSVVSGVHLESNGIADVVVDDARNVRLESILANNRVRVINTCTDVVMSSSFIERIEIGPDARRTHLENVTYNLSASGDIVDDSHDTTYVNVANNVSGHVDYYSTIGLWTENPNANIVGLTPKRLLDVGGEIQAEAFNTGDIKFRKDGKLLWRMFEDQHGLYVEEADTGEVSRVFLERDLAPVKARLSEQSRAIARLEDRLEALREQIRRVE